MKVAPIRIAYMGVKGLPSKSGTERVIEAITNRLIGKFDISVYCDADYTPPGTTIEGVHLIRIRTLRGKHMKPISLGILSAFHALFQGHYDVIHMNGIENCFTLPLLKLRYRIISTSHGIPSRSLSNKWNKNELFFIRITNYPFLYLSDYPTSISFIDSEYFRKDYRKKVTYIPNGVDLDQRVDQEAALKFIQNLGLTPNSYLLFIAGRILELKGCHLLLKAINTLQEDIPVLIIGDMEQVPAYSRELKNLARNHHVIFIPPIEDKALLFGILNLSKLFIFPSLGEGMSIMLLEAASLGVPMICSDIPENKIVLEENVTYFKSADHNNLSEKINWALSNTDNILELAQEARDWVRKNYSWDRIAAMYEALYQQCVQGIKESELDINPPAVS